MRDIHVIYTDFTHLGQGWDLSCPQIPTLVGGDMSFERRPYPPGQAGRARIKESEYLLQLQEKQKARFTYGVMEKQFRRYYEEANRRQGKTGDNLLILSGRSFRLLEVTKAGAIVSSYDLSGFRSLVDPEDEGGKFGAEAPREDTP